MRLIAANPKRKADVANVLSDEVVQTPGLLFLRACAADPAKRYHSAAELHSDLGRLKAAAPQKGAGA